MDEQLLWGDGDDHGILPDANFYSIVAIHIERDPEDGSEPFLDLTVSRTERRLLRFWSPQDLEIEHGGPFDTGGSRIQDISSRGLNGLGVRVRDCEGPLGAVSFGLEAPTTSLGNGNSLSSCRPPKVSL